MANGRFAGAPCGPAPSATTALPRRAAVRVRSSSLVMAGRGAMKGAHPSSAAARPASDELGGRCAAPTRSGPVVGVDADVVVREVAGPHGGAGGAAVQVDAHGDLASLHHALAV